MNYQTSMGCIEDDGTCMVFKDSPLLLSPFKQGNLTRVYGVQQLTDEDHTFNALNIMIINPHIGEIEEQMAVEIE
jgi:hypothetical protein